MYNEFSSQSHKTGPHKMEQYVRSIERSVGWYEWKGRCLIFLNYALTFGLITGIVALTDTTKLINYLLGALVLMMGGCNLSMHADIAFGLSIDLGEEASQYRFRNEDYFGKDDEEAFILFQKRTKAIKSNYRKRSFKILQAEAQPKSKSH